MRDPQGSGRRPGKVSGGHLNWQRRGARPEPSGREETMWLSEMIEAGKASQKIDCSRATSPGAVLKDCDDCPQKDGCEVQRLAFRTMLVEGSRRRRLLETGGQSVAGAPEAESGVRPALEPIAVSPTGPPSPVINVAGGPTHRLVRNESAASSGSEDTCLRSTPYESEPELLQESTVQISSINCAGLTRDIHGKYVDVLREAIGGGVPLPPVVIDVDHRVVDGAHRLEAHRRAGLTAVRALVFRYRSARDRLVHSVVLNRSHGLPLTKKNKRQLAVQLVGQGMCVKDTASVVAMSVSTVTAWTTDLRKERKDDLRQQISVLRAQGQGRGRIAAGLGVSEKRVRGLSGPTDSSAERASSAPNTPAASTASENHAGPTAGRADQGRSMASSCTAGHPVTSVASDARSVLARRLQDMHVLVTGTIELLQTPGTAPTTAEAELARQLAEPLRLLSELLAPLSLEPRPGD